jgi:methylmalonyl-CoA mutase
MIGALRAGLPQQAIAEAAAARSAAIAHRAFAITGTSAFPLLDEVRVSVLMPAPYEALEAAPGQDCAPLPSHRDAEPYERLRQAADENLARSGERPKVFLAKLGRPQDHGPASAFAANFFAAAGIEAAGSADDARAQEAAFRACGAKIACICAAPTVSIETLIEAARALRRAGALRIYVAGDTSPDAAAALQQAEAVDLICFDCDALAILNDALTVALGGRQR